MKVNMEAFDFYKKRIDELKQELTLLYKRKKVIAWLRFIIFIAVCISMYFLWQTNVWIIVAAVIAGISFFLIAVSKDINNNNTISNLETLSAIKEDEMHYLH